MVSSYCTASDLQVYIYIYLYSRTSSIGPSEKGTTSLQGTLPISPKVYMQYIPTSERRTASLQGTKWLVTKCPLLRGSTVLSDLTNLLKA